jgi:hypothetical protein
MDDKSNFAGKTDGSEDFLTLSCSPIACELRPTANPRIVTPHVSLLIFMIAPPFPREVPEQMARSTFPSEFHCAAKNLNNANFIPENFRTSSDLINLKYQFFQGFQIHSATTAIPRGLPDVYICRQCVD